MTPTLFQRLMGAEFYHLADEVKALHSRRGDSRYVGLCTVERGRNPLGRMACLLFGLPRAMRDAPIQVDFDAQGARETWRRSFNGSPMRSRLRFDGGLLLDQIGPARFHFRLFRIGKELHWVAERGRVLRLFPLPERWLDGVRCREYAEDGRYRFEVEARLPLFGRLLRYEGWLLPEPDAAQA